MARHLVARLGHRAHRDPPDPHTGLFDRRDRRLVTGLDALRIPTPHPAGHDPFARFIAYNAVTGSVHFDRASDAGWEIEVASTWSA